MLEIFQPHPPSDPVVQRLAALRDEAEAGGFTLLTYLIEVALVEAERIAEVRPVAIHDGNADVTRDAMEDRGPVE